MCIYIYIYRAHVVYNSCVNKSKIKKSCSIKRKLHDCFCFSSINAKNLQANIKYSDNCLFKILHSLVLIKSRTPGHMVCLLFFGSLICKLSQNFHKDHKSYSSSAKINEVNKVWLWVWIAFTAIIYELKFLIKSCLTQDITFLMTWEWLFQSYKKSLISSYIYLQVIVIELCTVDS